MKLLRILFMVIVLFSSSVSGISAQKTAVVIGGPRTLGLAITRALLLKDYQVTMFTHERPQVQKLFSWARNFTIVDGRPEEDAAKLAQTLKNEQNVFFCPHYDSYKQWESDLHRAVANVIQSVDRAATITFPSIVYATGKNIRHFTEQTPIDPCSLIGKAFAQAELVFEKACAQGLCKAVVLRHSLPFGPRFVDGLTSKVFENGVKGKKMEWLKTINVPFQLCYAPDLADAMIELGLTADKQYTLLHYGGYTLPSIKTWFQAIASAAQKKCRTRVYGGFLIKFASFFHPDAKAAKDIFYSFSETIILDDSQLFATYPQLKKTPLDEAIARSVSWFLQPSFAERFER